MEYVDYYAVVGVSPRACVNSVCSFVSKSPDISIRRLVFIVSQTEGGAPCQRSKETVASIIEGLSNPRLLLNGLDLSEADYLWIPEADLEGATKTIIESVLNRTRDDTRVIIDATAGRKVMASSAVVAALLLCHLHGSAVDINYYFLKAFNDDAKKKDYCDLNEGDAMTLIFSTTRMLREFGLNPVCVNQRPFSD